MPPEESSRSAATGVFPTPPPAKIDRVRLLQYFYLEVFLLESLDQQADVEIGCDRGPKVPLRPCRNGEAGDWNAWDRSLRQRADVCASAIG